MNVEKLAVDATFDAGKIAANTVKDIWSVLDAAAEKPMPSKYLGQTAIHAVQGVTQEAQKLASAE